VLENEDELETSIARVAELILAAHAEGAASVVQRFRSQSAQRERAKTSPIRTPEAALEAFLGWVDRRTVREPRVSAYLLGGLFGAGVDQRRRALKDSVPEAVLAALSGLTDEVSFELREELRESHPRHVARTLTGISDADPRAAGLRRALESVVPEDVVASSLRLDDALAWSLRDRLFDAHPDIVVGTLSGLDTERAWAMRDCWLAQRGSRLGDDYETARVASKSVGGVGGERAWELRTKARRAAPVSALASIGQLTDALSWRLREEFLHRAPKVVMATLRRLSAAPAWDMRRAVISDCKEALDSIQGLDDPEAWAMRESQLDIWPSTVVKTLGVLADSARGMALIERQLGAHPANVSLLKHASAVALGVHRVETFED
jgi:dTMP kinase